MKIISVVLLLFGLNVLLMAGGCATGPRSAAKTPPSSRPSKLRWTVADIGAGLSKAPGALYVFRNSEGFALLNCPDAITEDCTQVGAEHIRVIQRKEFRDVLMAAYGIPHFSLYLPVREFDPARRLLPQPKRRFTGTERVRESIGYRISRLRDFFEIYRSDLSSLKDSEAKLESQLKRIEMDLKSGVELKKIAEQYMAILDKLVDDLLTLPALNKRISSAGRSGYQYNLWASYFRPHHVITNFVVIPKGSFLMGSPDSERNRLDDEKLHSVTLSHDFEMLATEVTQLQWFLVMGYNPAQIGFQKKCQSEWTEINSTELCLNTAIGSVSWEDIQIFLTRINAGDTQYQYRLPTEAEWEYAARAGAQTAYPFGDDLSSLREYAFTQEDGIENGWGAVDVAQRKQNKFGLYDMLGNVYEWTNDWYGPYPNGPVTDPMGPPSGERKVWRGGAIGAVPIRGMQGTTKKVELFRSAYRDGWSPDFRGPGKGFRIIRLPK